MEPVRSTKENLDQSIGLLSQENAQRKSFLRLSTKGSTPKRISLQRGYVSRQNADEDNHNDVTSPMGRFELASKPIKHDISDFDESITFYACKKNVILFIYFLFYSYILFNQIKWLYLVMFIIINFFFIK